MTTAPKTDPVQATLDSLESLTVMLPKMRPAIYKDWRAVCREIAYNADSLYDQVRNWVISRSYNPTVTPFLKMVDWEAQIMISMGPEEVKCYKAALKAVKKTREK